jgi:hypothetical protein
LKLTPLANFFQITEEELQDICEKAIGSGKHHEFHLMAQNLSLPVEQVCSKICCWLSEELPDQFNELKKIVSSYID